MFINVALGIFALISLIILISALLNPLTRKIGFRNIKRRISSTVLVIIGCLVGTALISGSMVLSDSLDKTFLDLVNTQVGEKDMVIGLQEKTFFGAQQVHLTKEEADQVVKALPSDKIDGAITEFQVQASLAKLGPDGKRVINDYNDIISGITKEEIQKFGSEPITVPDYASGEAITSEKVAKTLELQEGDLLVFNYAEKDFKFQVKAIVPDNGFIAAQQIIVNPIDLTSVLGLPEGAINKITVSAQGGIRPKNYDGQRFTDEITGSLKSINLARVQLSFNEQKALALTGWGFKSFVSVFYVFSAMGALAGILLILNLYAMLAEERKMEMGILRAIAFKQKQLVQIFTYEGYVYSILSSLFGTILGLGVGYFLVWQMNRIGKVLGGLISASGEGGGFELKLKFSATPLSLVLAFVVGAIITIAVTIYASKRIARLNIVSAIRDTEDDIKPKQSRLRLWGDILIALLIAWAGGLIGLSYKISDLLEPLRSTGFSSFSNQQFIDLKYSVRGYMFYLGVVVAVFMTALLINRLVSRKNTHIDWVRIVTTIAAGLIITFNVLMNRVDILEKAQMTDYGTPIIFLSAVALILSIAQIITYNLDIFIYISQVIFKPFTKLQPVVLTAFRYPSVNRRRTGTTIVMFSMVIYLIVLLSMMNATMKEQNQKNATAGFSGYDQYIMPAPGTTHDQFSKLEQKVKALPEVRSALPSTSVNIMLPDFPNKSYSADKVLTAESSTPFMNTADPYYVTTLDAPTPEFLKGGNVALQSRLPEYADDTAAWQAVIDDPNKVILGSMMVLSFIPGKPEIKLGQEIRITDKFQQKTISRQVIGMVKENTSNVNIGYYNGIVTSSNHLSESLDKTYIDRYGTNSLIVDFKDNANFTEATNNLKKALIDDNIMVMINLSDISKTTGNIMDMLIRMFQGFLAFSLLVGASGLGIIMTRSVEERRQQIGMLRSLGYQRKMIWNSFFIESSFIVLLGIIVGLISGTIGAKNVFTLTYKDMPDVKAVIPYGEIAMIVAAVYVAAILFSLLPAIKASKLSPVEATNYPE